MVSAVKVKSGFRLAELDLDRRLADAASYLQKLRKLQFAMLGLEQIYRSSGAAASSCSKVGMPRAKAVRSSA